ncbi:MAG TPA: Gfo/Idh/MocA family oxidoreductase [Vicinamibacterales bacterium]|nr:Gfo/Idh/MocA family oxidoreductase [Vicinamibacterales bacterium]
MAGMTERRLGVGFIGSGFITRFHIRSWQAVRDADVRGVWSPNPGRAENAAALARELRVGEARAFASIEAMVEDPAIDCIWICGPNFARVENMERIVNTLARGATLVGVACEKPLGRNAAEASRMVELVEQAGVLHGYLENQLFAPAVERGKAITWARGAALAGRPYLARAAEEHGGPHEPWFWRGDLQGGGVLNDMMCHSLEVGRYLLTRPGAPRTSIRPTRVSAQVATLKWSRPEYIALLQEMMTAEVDYGLRPAEDFARATVNYVDEDGLPLIVEATTSWSFVGAGLRLSMELLGPEYSMSVNTLETGTKVFLSRRLRGEMGEDLVEKQNAEQGLAPILGNESADYGYEGENRAFVQAFRDGIQPELGFHAGRDVTELLMACYMSAEQERVIDWKPEGLLRYVPPVARPVGAA